MAKLKLRIPTLDGLPDAQKSLYRAFDVGGFILDYEPDPDGFGIDNLAALRGKLSEAQTDAERQKRRVQGYAKPDGSLYTVEEIQALVADSQSKAGEIETLKSKTKTNEEKLADLVAAAKRPLEAELNKHKGDVERYRKHAHSGEHKRAVDSVLEKLNPQPKWRGHLAREVGAHIEVREKEDGTLFHVFIDPASKQPRMSSLSGRDGPMDAAEFAGGEFRKNYLDCLVGDGKAGADIVDPKNNGGGGGRNGADVVLPKGHTQAQFEEAFSKASKQGGQVRFEE